MCKCWCIREIISFLQINKNGNTLIWPAYLSWVEIKQQLPKELANLTRQDPLWLPTSAKVVTRLLMNYYWFCSGAFSKVNAKRADQVVCALHPRRPAIPVQGLWGWTQQHSSSPGPRLQQRSWQGWSCKGDLPARATLCSLMWQKVNWSM